MCSGHNIVPAAMFERWPQALLAARRKHFLPRPDHVCNTTYELFRFHNNKFDEMPCKLDFSENLCSFEKYPTPS